ncbi:malate synthase G [Williamsia sp.]|uniref:malate synthase G n=1 Tax=Williamsia sp. TaxID=1872085 RepID=UPI002F9336AC
MTAQRVRVGRLQVAEELHQFLTDEVLPGSGVQPDTFWRAAEAIIADLAPRSRELLAVRDRIQTSLDQWHRAHPGPPGDIAAYQRLLREIGYLVPEPEDFAVTTTGVDAEVCDQAGPQLVVPLLNARFAVNAANARWGSLYDALYGTDAVDRGGVLAPGTSHNPARAAEVIARGRELLDRAVPLATGSHADAVGYAVGTDGLIVVLSDGTVTGLGDAGQFVGHRTGDELEAVVLAHHGLHLEIHIDRVHPIGASDAAGVKDIVLESAVTTIMDLEDSVAAVDPADKVLGYRNWLLLMQGRLSERVTKGGATFLRSMNPDRLCTAGDGSVVTLHGRSLLFVRHVGLLLTTDAILDAEGAEIPEGILDALVTALCSLHDLRGNPELANSRTGSMYFVKPKMHGPDEVALTVEMFTQIEEAYGLPFGTIKLGIMDEERRTSVNLKACIHQARDRIAFINTGFLDRTGDEIHTSMQAGPVVRKVDMRDQAWLAAYERHNVDVGLAAGFAGVAQIGKGMWAMPDLMSDMLAQKIGQLQAGASTSWVPSPTAATLHAIHYHQVDVAATQRELSTRKPIGIDPILALPVAADLHLGAADRRRELDNNVQSILGYVVRWIDQGVGCSKVPDLHGVALMEDRATLRISSQLLANWLLHGVIARDDVLDSLHRMAPVVDGQNAGDPRYEPLAVGDESLAFCAARDLILLGAAQPSGYTEPILHSYRRQKKEITP